MVDYGESNPRRAMHQTPGVNKPINWRKARESNSNPFLDQSVFETVTSPACLTFHIKTFHSVLEPVVALTLHGRSLL